MAGFARNVANKSEEYIQRIKDSEIFEGLSESERSLIINSIKTENENLLEFVSRSSDRCHVNWKTRRAGTSNYTQGSGRIEMFAQKDEGQSFESVFWHEYGHFSDDKEMSGAKASITELVTKRGYYDAAVKDINDFLKKAGLSGKYYFKPSESSFIKPKMVLKKTGAEITSKSDPEAMIELTNALKNAIDEISGRSKLREFAKTLKAPDEVKWEDYFELYETPKRKILKQRERFKGAKEKYQKDIENYYKEKDAFEEKNEESIKRYIKMEEEVIRAENELAAVTDTFDGAAKGAFSSNISLGGHLPEYYAYRDNSIREGTANVFSSLITGNPHQKEGFEKICPTIYELFKEVIENEI